MLNCSIIVRVMEETGMKAVEHLSILMPAMLNLVRDIDPVVARQAIITGTNLFGNVLEEMALQVGCIFCLIM